MATNKIDVPLPPGFTLDAMPALPPGFTLDSPTEKKWGGGRGATSSWDKPSDSEYYINQAKKGVANLAALPGLAVDASQALLNAPHNLSRGAIPRFGGKPGRAFGSSSRTAKAAGNMLGTRNIPADSIGQKVAGKAIEYGIGGAPFMARSIMGAGASKLAAAASETGSLAGASVGGAIGEDVGGATGEMIGAITGGISGAVTPTLTGKAASALHGRFSESARKAAGEKKAAALLSPIMRSQMDIPENMRAAEETKNSLRNFGQLTPTLSGRTGSAVAGGIESAIASKDPDNLFRYSENFNKNQKISDSAKQAWFGEKKASSLANVADSRVRNASKMIDKKIAEVDRQKRDISSTVIGKDSQDVGDALRGKYWEARMATSGAFKEGYNDIYRAADSAKVKIRMDDVYEEISSLAKADENFFQAMPITIKKAIQEADAPTPGLSENAARWEKMQAEITGKKTKTSEESFQKFHSLWKEVNSETGAALRSGDMQRHQYLSVLKNRLASKIEELESGGLGNISEAFKNINSSYKTKYLGIFREGVGGRIASLGKYGASVEDAAVVKKFFTPDGMDDFAAIYGDNPQAQQLLKEGVLGLFSKQAVNTATGEIIPGAAESFLRNNAQTLKKIPDIHKILSSSRSASEALAERSSRLIDGKVKIGKSILQKIAKTEDVDSVIASAIQSPKTLRSIFAAAKTPNDKLAVARSFVDQISKMEDPYKVIMSRENDFKPIFDRLGPDHWRNLKTITGAETMQQRMKPPANVTLEKIKDTISDRTGSSPASLATASLSVARGRTQPIHELSVILTRFGIIKSQKEADKLMNEAIYDEKLAKHLAEAVDPRKKFIPTNSFMMHVKSAIGRGAAAYAGGDQASNGIEE